MRLIVVSWVMMVFMFLSGAACVEPDCIDQTGKKVYCDSDCCKVCENSKPCGDSCISVSQTCNVGPGCACSPS